MSSGVCAVARLLSSQRLDEQRHALRARHDRLQVGGRKPLRSSDRRRQRRVSASLNRRGMTTLVFGAPIQPGSYPLRAVTTSSRRASGRAPHQPLAQRVGRRVEPLRVFDDQQQRLQRRQLQKSVHQRVDAVRRCGADPAQQRGVACSPIATRPANILSARSPDGTCESSRFSFPVRSDRDRHAGHRRNVPGIDAGMQFTIDIGGRASHRTTIAPSASARSSNSTASRDLPMPGSPETTTVLPSPSRARDQHSSSRRTSSARPTSATLP